MSQSQLVDRILVNKPEADKAILNKAYIFGTKMHGRQLRACLLYTSPSPRD